ncbi:MAG: hypothetical protein A2542_03430 [Parcubacteria group bacterium RIFOXYD2_FULL_52_8]|nr:MAG: hypothetical protein A2542_03430 [Parcubacteria group bacterium RIFOXYD2_FULL_52_8]
MEQPLITKSKRKIPLLKLSYQQVEPGEFTLPALDKAFDILFEEVLERGLEVNISTKIKMATRNN